MGKAHLFRTKLAVDCEFLGAIKGTLAQTK